MIRDEELAESTVIIIIKLNKLNLKYSKIYILHNIYLKRTRFMSAHRYSSKGTVTVFKNVGAAYVIIMTVKPFGIMIMMLTLASGCNLFVHCQCQCFHAIKLTFTLTCCKIKRFFYQIFDNVRFTDSQDFIRFNVQVITLKFTILNI